MATIILKLDTRRANGKGLFPIKVQISHNSASVNISTGIYIKREHWLGVEINKMIKPTSSNAKVLNEDLERIYFQYSNALRELSISQFIDNISACPVLKNRYRFDDTKIIK
ncbi:MAG: Arm DNA-binding domain-containing protein, partial [Alistipes sp.]